MPVWAPMSMKMGLRWMGIIFISNTYERVKEIKIWAP